MPARDLRLVAGVDQVPIGARTAADQDTLTDAGQLANGLHYEARLTALNEGGSLTATNGTLTFTGCTSLTLILAAGTDYVMDYQKNYRGELPEARVNGLVRAAAAKSYAELKAAHETDFRIRTLSVDLLLPPRRPAREFAGAVE